MAKILEHHSKSLLKKLSIPVPKGILGSSFSDLKNGLNKLTFPLIVKALIPVGKKGKLGVVKKVENIKDCEIQISDIIGKKIDKYIINQVLVEECIKIKKELYVSITYDNLKRSPIVIFSPLGGIDVEFLIHNFPDRLHSYSVNILEGFYHFQAREICLKAGLNARESIKIAQILVKLYNVFINFDARLLEINPLVISEEGDVYAVGSVLNIDDDALYRHPELEGIASYGKDRSLSGLTKRELKVLEADREFPGSGAVRYTDFDEGNIAVAVIGGGASLVVMDSIYKGGSLPSNYSDVGPGKGLEAKFKVMMNEALSKPGIEALFIGAAVIVAVDIAKIAKIIKQVLKELNFESMGIPIVARWAGLGDNKAKAEFQSISNCRYFGREISIEEAAEIVAKLVKK